MPQARSLVQLFQLMPENERIIVDVLRQIITETLPTYCKEKMSFGVPYFYGNKGVCIVWPATVPRGGIKSGVLLGYWYGCKLKDTMYASKEHSFDISPFLRYYILPAKQKVNVFAEVAYLHSSVTSEIISPPPGSTSKSKWNGYTISAGPAFFLTKNVALELTLSYQRNTTTKDKTFIAGAGFQIHI